MDSKTIAAAVLATSIWVGLAVVAVGGATTTGTGEFWMSAKAKVPPSRAWRSRGSRRFAASSRGRAYIFISNAPATCRGQRRGATKTASARKRAAPSPRDCARPRRGRRGRSARRFLRADRLEGDVHLRPRLDLDEGDGAAARHDEVDLAADRRIAPGERAVALQHQRRERLRLRRPGRGRRRDGARAAVLTARPSPVPARARGRRRRASGAPSRRRRARPRP